MTSKFHEEVHLNRKLKILYVGNGSIGSNALSLSNGFLKNGVTVDFVETVHFDSPGRKSFKRVVLKFFPNIYGSVSSLILGAMINKRIKIFQPDVLFVFKGNYLASSTLMNFTGLKMHYHPDDSSNAVNRTLIFSNAERYYDIHISSKRHNLSEIAIRTQKPVFFIWYAYDEDWHMESSSPNLLGLEFKVGFIGHSRPDRITLMESLALRFGKGLALSGLKWERSNKLRQKATIIPPVYGKSFSDFARRIPIQIGLLNSDNRDQHTARSFEIPATGALLIAQDTREHREIFKSEQNALFFNDLEELVQKIEWAHANPVEAAKIAKNGHDLIVNNANSWTDRANEIIHIIYSHFKDID